MYKIILNIVLSETYFNSRGHTEINSGTISKFRFLKNLF